MYDYLDYRAFFRDWYACKVAHRPHYSMRAFARRAGCSHSLVSQVLRGRRDLSQQTAAAFGSAMGLAAAEIGHFVLLVERSTAQSAPRRRELTHQALGSTGLQRAMDIEELGRGKLGSWWIPAVRELAHDSTFESDPDWICRQLRPPISRHQAAQALEVLVALGLLVPSDTGRLTPHPAPLMTRPESRGDEVREFHRSVIGLAGDGLEDLPHSDRFYQAAVLAIPESVQESVEWELRRCAERVMGMVQHAREAGPAQDSQVMVLNLNLVPISVDHR